MNATPAEIAKRFLPPLPGKLGDVQAEKLIAALSEHYHLLPKVEVVESPEFSDDDWNRFSAERGRIEREAAANEEPR